MQGNVILWALAKIQKMKLSSFKDTAINNSKEEKILGVTTGSKLTFSSHVRELCKKASQKYRLCQEYQTNFMILKKFFFLML